MRKRDGTLPSPATLRGVRAALHRHLTGAPLNRSINILKGEDFLSANEAFNAACKRFYQKGGEKPKHKPIITSADMSKMGSFCRDYKENPIKLQEAVWFLLTLNFGRRGREGFRSMTKDTFGVGQDDTGRYIYQRRLESTKNHQGTSREERVDYETVKVYESTMNAVEIYEFYVSKLSVHDSLFQKPKEGVSTNDQVWYKNAPLGVHKLDSMMPAISRHAGLSLSYTNHSVRATTVTSLAKANVPEKTIMSITKHKNPTSLLHYTAEPENQEKRRCSEVLSNALLSKGRQLDVTDSMFEDISDDELNAAYTDTMQSFSQVTGCTVSASLASPPCPLIIQSGAVLNGCTFNFNIS